MNTYIYVMRGMAHGGAVAGPGPVIAVIQSASPIAPRGFTLESVARGEALTLARAA